MAKNDFSLPKLSFDLGTWEIVKSLEFLITDETTYYGWSCCFNKIQVLGSFFCPSNDFSPTQL